MLWFLSAIGSALVFGLAGLFMKISQMRSGSAGSLLLGLYTAGTLGFWGQALLNHHWTPLDWRIWIAGAIVGLGSAWGNLLFMKALDYGPASLTSPLTNANILLVIAMGAIWYGEPLQPIAAVGVVCLLFAVLLAIRNEGSYAVKSSRWYGLVLLAMLLFFFRNGGLKVTDALGLDNTNVLWSGYLLSWLWFAVSSRKEASGSRSDAESRSSVRAGSRAEPKAKSRAGADVSAGASPARTGFLWGLVAGVCSYGGLQLYASALGEGPSHLVAPIFATNGLVVALGSVLLYRERLTVLQWGAFAFLMLGLVLVRI
ncbi:DMT family transporter [Cohnella fermenti]|uniref:DMT family transporter n=1 Tax=Cohnella fermenti TaxID=2565925 RepID=A0A4S4BRV0_9BACL|nr:DMT family transporter [Cohnella fermenti]THF76911.1 DMT family transporter [Cohnella fermenti]